LKSLVEDRVIDEASHCDFESPTDRLCQVFCGDAAPARQAIVRQTLHDAVRDWLLRPATAGTSRDVQDASVSGVAVATPPAP
jgi:hypothetical protein